MGDHRSEFSVERMAKVLDVSKSGYLGISKQPYYRCHREYGGMEVDQAQRLKELDRED